MNSFGRIFRISLFGASHAPLLGVDIEGCPAGIALGREVFEPDLARRRGGTPGTTSRTECDIPFIERGCQKGYTTGEALSIFFENRNIRREDYSVFRTQPRPGHADWVALQKYGNACDRSGGGIFSGRMTLPLVAAGVVAKRLLQREYPQIQLSAGLLEVGGRSVLASAIQERAAGDGLGEVIKEAKAADEWGEVNRRGQAIRDRLGRLIKEAKAAGDSLGGVIGCRVAGVPVGLGEPFFDSVESCISHLAFSIPGIKGIEFGAGFASARMCGSEHNDCYMDAQGHTATNHAGGISGGVTNGNELIFRVAVKPTPSISRAQETFDFALNQMAPLSIKGRHDTCFALRLSVVIEAITAIVLADFSLINK